jgi:hypothetical protein
VARRSTARARRSRQLEPWLNPLNAARRCSASYLWYSPAFGRGGCSPTLGPGVSRAGHHDRRTLQSSRGCPAHRVGIHRIGSGIAESSRSHDFRVPATSTGGRSSVLTAHETPGPNAGSPMPRWGCEPARGRGAIPAAKQASVPAVGRRGHSERRVASTIPRYQRPSGVLRQNVRGTLLQPCIDR